MTDLDRTPLLTTRALEVGWSGRAFLPPLDVAIRPGELWALIGRNGGGKTTLLRTLVGTLPAVRGSVSREGATAYVAQKSQLAEEVPARVIDLVRGGTEVGLSFLRPGFRRGREAAVREALAAVDASDLASARFSQISEGQKQRVLLARALASGARLLVLDEPTAAMDLTAERAAFELLARLRRERDLAQLVVGHHVPVLLAHATHVILVDKDDRIALAGPLDAVTRERAFLERYGAHRP